MRAILTGDIKNELHNRGFNVLDRLLMASEKTKELREWATFVISALTLLIFPCVWLIFSLAMDRQKLQIERDADAHYVHAENFATASARWDTGIGEVRGSLNAVLIQQTHLADAVDSLKERIDLSQQKRAP